MKKSIILSWYPYYLNTKTQFNFFMLLAKTQRESWWRLHFMEYPAPAISAVLQEEVDSQTQDHLQRICRRLLPQDIILGMFLGSLNSIHCLIYGSLLSGRIMIIWSKTWMTTFITTKLIKHVFFQNLSNLFNYVIYIFRT